LLTKESVLVQRPSDEDDVWNLADFFLGFFAGEDLLVGAGEEFAGKAAVEDGDAGAADEVAESCGPH
jgi:hypothetical protein